MKRFFISAAVVAILGLGAAVLAPSAFAPAAFAAGASTAAPIEPLLLKQMEAAGPASTAPLTAIVLCDTEFPRRALRGTAGEVKRALRAHATRTQASIVSDCAAIDVATEPLWIVNALIVKTDPARIRRIADFKGVRALAANHVHRLPKSTDGPAHRDSQDYVWSQLNMNTFAAREVYGLTGSGVRVGQLDSGVYGDHKDLKGKIYAWKDFINNKPTPYDDHSHGTHTAGSMIGGNHSGQWIGGAPDAKLAAAKIFSASGASDDAVILKAMQWIMDPDGNPETNDAPRVVNNSWGDDEVTFGMRPAVQAWVAANILPAFSNGNSGPYAGTVASPAAYEESFGVGASKSTFDIASFSSRGPAKYEGKTVIKPDISAPGASVISSLPNGKWGSKSGTSMSCPSLCGVIAILYQAQPNISIPQMRTLLESTAKDRGTPGKDNSYGAGNVDARAALERIFGTPARAGAPRTTDALTAADRVIEALEREPTDSVRNAARFLRDRLMMIETPEARAKVARLTELLR